MKLTSQMIKEKAEELGIGCLAIGNIERFKNAPELMSPISYFPDMIYFSLLFTDRNKYGGVKFMCTPEGTQKLGIPLCQKA